MGTAVCSKLNSISQKGLSMTVLRQRMAEDMQVRSLALNTQTSYVQQVSLFARHFHNRRNNPISLQGFPQKGLELRGRHSAPKKPQRLPVVLSPAEVFHFLSCVGSTKHWAILTTSYAAGLRITEAIHLKLVNIASQRIVIQVEQGKGQKDRYVMLSPKLLETPCSYFRAVRPNGWLFEGDIYSRPTD
jgi:site-specific recombinase XerD